MSKAIKPPQWMDSAVCASVDSELFFPEAGQRQLADDAKAICKRCPVQADCLNYALDQPDLIGVWGGYSDRERRHLRNRRAAA